MSAFRRLPWPLAGAVLLAFASHAPAAVTEEQFDLPVEVIDGGGQRIAQPIRVTVFADSANPRPAPVVVLGHGRAGDPQGRAGLGRARYGEASRFFVRRGFIVAVPTRIGYGVSGGEDVEDSGRCADRRYAPAYAAAAQQMLQVLAAVRRRPDAAQDRALLVGQSFGGTAVLAAAALQPPGLQAVANFAQFPPQGEDGHSTFARFPQTWQPVIAAWLDRIGLPAPGGGRAVPLPPRTTREPATHE